MALSEKMNLYLRLERIMIDLDDQENPYADKVRDLMDPIWYSMSKEEHAFLDGRGEIDLRILYPITLTIDDLFQKLSDAEPSSVEITHSNSSVGRQFALVEAIPCAA